MSEQDAPRPAPDAGEIEELLDVLICTTALAATQHYMVVPRWCERGVPPPADVRTQRQAVLDALLAAAARADALAGEVARLRAALAWYADSATWLPPEIDVVQQLCLRLAEAMRNGGSGEAALYEQLVKLSRGDWQG